MVAPYIIPTLSPSLFAVVLPIAPLSQTTLKSISISNSSMEIGIVAAGKSMVSQTANSSLDKLEIMAIDTPEVS